MPIISVSVEIMKIIGGREKCDKRLERWSKSEA